jgi:hypothetical protein
LRPAEAVARNQQCIRSFAAKLSYGSNRRGISQSEAYHAVTRKGDDPDTFPEASGLPLERAEALQLRLHSTLVGVLPAIITGCRHDFVVLVQALVKRNEPEPIPDSMGSCLVSGYNNWDRVYALRRRWETSESDLSWVEEFHRYVKPHKQLYQDRFLILSSDAYSHIPAEALGLSDAEWRAMSITIRLEHEATHYLVSRLYAQIRTNVLDELWADYVALSPYWVITGRLGSAFPGTA